MFVIAVIISNLLFVSSTVNFLAVGWCLTVQRTNHRNFIRFLLINGYQGIGVVLKLHLSTHQGKLLPLLACRGLQHLFNRISF